MIRKIITYVFIRPALSPKNIFRLFLNLPKLITLFFRLLFDNRVKLGVKIIPLLGIAYIISPIDIIPDFLIPVAGWLEDFIILYFCMKIFAKLVPREIIDEHIQAIESTGKFR